MQLFLRNSWVGVWGGCEWLGVGVVVGGWVWLWVGGGLVGQQAVISHYKTLCIR